MPPFLFAPLRAALPAVLALLPATVRAEALTLTVPAPHPAEQVDYKMGASRRPDGRELTVDSRSLRLDGQPWVPVMGEFHYARYPAAEWREELLKMKAGGVDIVSTYVFWIYHEETEGAWDWSGSRNLQGFVEAARDAGLAVIVRCGPWCHGEVRNGGVPDWAVARFGAKLRTTDPQFLGAVRALYGQIAGQLHGLLWKDGGPVAGIQLDNEYHGPAAYLLALKGLARDAGLDTPLYTRTGWPALSTPMPAGEILPLYGVYAEGFWDREITPMPGRYWAGFHFATLRSDAAIATDILGRRDAKDDDDAARYPYLTCEIGGGMMSSYHRRILVDPRDVASTTLVKLGSGGTLPGYYMYHGGTNPDGQLSTLMEQQATVLTNWNDMPVKNYDFQAPLGQFGQIRPQYHLLRRLHLFLHDYGSALAGMPAVLPDRRPAGRDDFATLRWAVRSDGRAGFVFVNNYQRLQPLPPKPGVQFALTLNGGKVLTFPSQPVTVPADIAIIWPFNIDLGGGVTLAYATAQPVSHVVDDGGVRTVFFAGTPGVDAEFAFPAGELEVEAPGGQVVRESERIVVRNVHPGHAVALQLQPKSGPRVQVVLLDEADSLALWKGAWRGRSRVFLTRDGLVCDGDALRLTPEKPAASVAVLPAPAEVSCEKSVLAGEPDGIFRRFTLPPRVIPAVAVEAEPVQPAGPAREIHNGPIKEAVPQEPSDSDFAAAAVWRIKFPAGYQPAGSPLLRLHYTGDVARITLNGRLLTDDFYNGNALDLGLERYGPEILTGDLRVAVLPLRKDAPIYLAREAWPEFAGAASVARLDRVEVVPVRTETLTAK